jgi:phage terminase Nu1 subunit (DNA packaging protein)
VSERLLTVERYVDASELAALMGVSTRTVKRWTVQGMPSEDWGIRVRRYLPSKCIAWVRARRRTSIDIENQPRSRRLTSATAAHQEE